MGSHTLLLELKEDFRSTVFAAPIATGLGGNAVALSVPLAESTLTYILAQAVPIVEGVKARVSEIAADPAGFAVDKVVAAMADVAPALHLISVKLDSLNALVDKDAILQFEDGAAKTTPAAVASDMVDLIRPVENLIVFLLGLESVDALKATCEAIKTEVAYIKTGIESTSVASEDLTLLGSINNIIVEIISIVGL
ncbi:hypothetical protein BDV93DRAFT_556535 [Ceratobasidium sp. AG-I]|nr:hypothetical protein BDV93DRAFT_556535 [Ceratobasidium sp. AG-I]